jgi:hypothetical protein
MPELPKKENPTAFPDWSRAVTGMLECQWELLQAPCRLGLTFMETVLCGSAGSPDRPAPRASAVEEDVQGLQRQALERLRKGLAPPSQIYDVRYRNRIDWLAFPAWARPNDPDLYEGCGHEG